MIWVLIVVLAIGTLAFKALGPLLAGGATPPASANRVIELLTPALLASLVVASTFGDGQNLVIDARFAGVLMGLALLWLRVPLFLVLVAAATVAAVVGTIG